MTVWKKEMKIFTDEFVNFLKRTFWCSWRGHKKGKWVEVYWAVAHSAGYKSRFCEICHKALETTKEKRQNFKVKSNKNLC